MQDQPGSGRRSAREPRPGAQQGWSPLAGHAISPLPHHGDQPGSLPVHAATTCWVSLPDISRHRRESSPNRTRVRPRDAARAGTLPKAPPSAAYPHPRVLHRRNRASPIKWLAARPAGAAMSARPVSHSKIRPLRRHSQRASSRSAYRACMTMHDQPVPENARICRDEVRRDRRACAHGFPVRTQPGLCFRPPGVAQVRGAGVGCCRADDERRSLAWAAAAFRVDQGDGQCVFSFLPGMKAILLSKAAR